MSEELERAIEALVEELGFELVEAEDVGLKSRPTLRLRIDRWDSEPGQGVTVEDCARVSRALEPLLDSRSDVPGSYILEVSSPGVERPLRKRRDFDRYTGREVAIKGFGSLAGRGKRLEGVLRGIRGEGDGERVELELPDGTNVEIPRAEIARANLIYRWAR